MCYKIKFNKREAQTVLNNNRERRGLKSHRGRKEIRAYQCEECNMWHLTSMETDEFNEWQKQNSHEKSN